MVGVVCLVLTANPCSALFMIFWALAKWRHRCWVQANGAKVTIFVPFVLLDFKTFNNRFVSDFKKDNDWNSCRVSACLCLESIYLIYMLYIPIVNIPVEWKIVD